MADNVQSNIQLTDAQALVNFLGSQFPNYKISARGKKVVVIGTGSATGVGVLIRGPNQARLNWQFPSMGVQLVLMLAIVFTGLLPGLLLFLIVWLSVKNGVNQIKQEVTQALQSGGAAQPHAAA